jgi:hypothetical protein
MHLIRCVSVWVSLWMFCFPLTLGHGQKIYLFSIYASTCMGFITQQLLAFTYFVASVRLFASTSTIVDFVPFLSQNLVAFYILLRVEPDREA